MAIPSGLLGATTGPIVHDVDERWLMAYAAGISDHRSELLDTSRAGGIVAHPAFIVCPEWPAIVASREQTIAAGVSARDVSTSVHASHDTTLHRPIRPGDRLHTSLEVVALEQKRPGARSTFRLRTTDDTGALVATTTQQGIWLGVALDGPDHVDPNPPTPLIVERDQSPTETMVALSSGAAHVYTECARIWNPIHTNPVAATAAGLGEIILHGTANLAYGVSAALDAVGLSPAAVTRVACRFAAMVTLPSELTCRVWTPRETDDGTVVPFEVCNAAGEPAVADGVLIA